MLIKDSPNYELSSSELAKWLEQQPAASWWSVDGDPLLTGLLTFPCPVDELVPLLRRINKPLLVLNKNKGSGAHGQAITADALGALADSDKEGNRIFQFCWKDRSSTDWILAEDKETEKSIRELGEAKANAVVNKT